MPMPEIELPGEEKGASERMGLVDIVGPVCESSDVLAEERWFPDVEEGGLIAFFSAGAYGFTMSSSYNTRPRTCEILVDVDNFSTIRKRETYEDLIVGEKEFLDQ
jgi:diaminopimelate decarboxylase